MDRRTMRGKAVGSYRQPLGEWAYWPERKNGENGFMVVAPSGARIHWVRTEDEARASVAEETAIARSI